MNTNDNKRQFAFTIEDVLIYVVENNGNLDFTVSSLGNDDLRGLFFDFNRAGILSTLELNGVNINNSDIEDEGVVNLKQGVNLQGTGLLFDIGIAFGTAGDEIDVIQQTEFTLSSTTSELTLDDIANVEFGVRTTSDGDKLTAIAPAAPDANNDSITTNEDTATNESISPNDNLLTNDTDADGDPLIIVAVNGLDTLVDNQFTLTTGGLITVNSDGTFVLNPNGEYEDLAVGEIREDSFTYKITDALLDPNNQGFDTATANIIFTGVNDAPIISVDSGNSSAETVFETNAPLATTGTLTVSDIDTTDFVTSSVKSVSTSGKDNDASTPNNAALLGMLGLPLSPTNNILDDTEQTDTLNWSFDSNGEAFNYLADDENLVLTFIVEALDDNSANDTQTVTITVDGTNDRPIAQDVAASVGEDDPSVTGSFVATDVDSTDILSYEIIAQPTDANGRQYGSVTNNSDGTFTFYPLDNFQFLDDNESRDVTFQYKAIDDSGVAATNTSVEKTATITVNGAYDAPTVVNEELLFQSFDQSMWDTGDATQIDWREFYGANWNTSFNQKIVDSGSLTIVPKLEDPITGLDIYDGYKVKSPEVSVDGSTNGRAGISPYFELDSGSVDSNIPVDIDLTYDVQYESGDTINILTGYSVANDAFFNTASPSIRFGIDLVFEFFAQGNLNIGSSTFGGASTSALFPTINIDIDETNIPGGTDANLIDFSSKTGISSDVFVTTTDNEWLTQDGQGGYIIGHPDFETNLLLSFPSIDTTGVLTGPTRLESTGSDDVAVLHVDVDEILSESKYFPPMRFNGEEGLHERVNLPGFVNDLGFPDVDVDLFSVNWDFEVIDVDLISTLTAVQDFTLDINELPLMVELENNDIITGFKLGDTISIDLPDWDVDLLGDQDGMMDYAISIDMDAMLNNWTTLDFSIDLLARAFKAQFGYTSDVVGDRSFSLFNANINDGFFFAQDFELLNVSPLAELFGDEDPNVSGFDLVGFNTEIYENGFVIS